MYQGTKRNYAAKKAIVDAFFRLLRKKHFSDIKVTEIVNEANVARVTYYRNFYYKEDIVKGYVENLHQELIQFTEASPNFANILLPKNFNWVLVNAFTLAKKNKTNFLLLYDNGFSNLLLDLFNEYAEKVLASYHNLDKYRVLIISGSIFNITIQWLKNDTPESVNELAANLVKLLSIDDT
ncbi:TetR/AcrR family transcriptional regulator [Lactobacillus sp. ESL0684]|uniref:TetR/AcrR family transcriptional regulator n=1 Tax=unclassified Lactobacillus TaxID=2620435 RepID=UPI0023F7C05D|nr:MULTISPECIES: TetR/AcrR family transcriptional regulator [unclassified Lactobacillus]WEV40414.1 TetR/AcrR family transcriptional regulator [Lactobacillus sp. ESL0681]WEV43137.1 TetR/AcrR family transcriptional regulator [Lactobacillus sp. ESL0684]